jgi:hypothetical protein
LGPHFAAQQPALGAHFGAAAAQQPFFAAAQRPALVVLAFLTFFGLAEQAPQLLREIGAHVAEAAVGATAMVRPPATASIVARLIDFVIERLLKKYYKVGLLPLAQNEQVTNVNGSFEPQARDQEIFCHSPLA